MFLPHDKCSEKNALLGMFSVFAEHLLAKEDYNETDIVIDFNLICEWLEIRKENLKRILISKFEKNYDYTETKLTKKTAQTNNYIEIKITPQCFKELCMISQTKKAKDVRKYFLEMEKLVRRFHEDIQKKILTQVGKLKTNQKGKINLIGGYVYVFETPDTDLTIRKVNGVIEAEEKKLHKLGKSEGLDNRFKVYNTGVANKLYPIVRVKVTDIHAVEKCTKDALVLYKYRKYKEIYDASPKFIEDLIKNCKVYLEALKKRYIRYEKKCKKELNRIKNNENKMFLVLLPIEK